ncbi:MAG: DUF4369 domain-containing protein [Bacteroidales bacterium]|nr:DUF4369 domain-containing protein [Bacteroidales bacterium]
MKHFYTLLLFSSLITLGACQQRMDIQGSTTIPMLEDRMLYLRVYKDGDLAVIDSARITHGKFHFQGPEPDSTVMASLFMDDESIMPIVIESGCPLTVTLNDNVHCTTGTALNDTLFAFIKRKTAVDAQLADLPHRESQMILAGMDHDDILAQLHQEAALLSEQEDDLVMGFIKDNMNNVLGPGVFMIITSSLPYPILNPRLEELVTLASPYFLADPYVQEYLRMARENMEKINE